MKYKSASKIQGIWEILGQSTHLAQRQNTHDPGPLGYGMTEPMGMSEDSASGAPFDANSFRKQWASASIAQMVDRLCLDHARWIKKVFPEIEEQLFHARRMSPHSPALDQIAAQFHRLSDELAEHFQGEEQVLFPTAIALEQARLSDSTLVRPAFGSVRNPVTMLGSDHQNERDLVDGIRTACQQYQLPDDSPEPLQHLYRGLQELELTLHQHRDLEDAILFPRVVELERDAHPYRSA